MNKKCEKLLNFGNFKCKKSFLRLKSFYLCGMSEEYLSILERTSCLYKKYGIKSVTMDDVSRELGISKKTLYQYFADKEELVTKIIDHEIELRNKEFDMVFASNLNAIDELFEVNRLMMNMLKEYSPATEYDLKKYYPALFERIHQIKSRRMYELVLQNMKKGKEQGIYRQEMNEEVIAKMHVTRIMNMPENSMFSREELFSPSVIMEAFVYHIRGIANQKGLEILEQNLKKLNESNKQQII